MHAHKHTRRHTEAQQQLYYGRFERVCQLSVGLFGQKHIHHWFDSRVGRKTTLVLMQNKNNQPTTWSVMHKLMVVSWFVCCCSYFTFSFLRRWQLPPRVELDTPGWWATRSLSELQFEGECGLFFSPLSRHQSVAIAPVDGLAVCMRQRRSPVQSHTRQRLTQLLVCH